MLNLAIRHFRLVCMYRNCTFYIQLVYRTTIRELDDCINTRRQNNVKEWRLYDIGNRINLRLMTIKANI